MKKAWNVVLWIWQLPQNLIGVLGAVFFGKDSRAIADGVHYYCCKGFPGGITLGEYIFVETHNVRIVRHEFGHVLQSRMLGPLYLLVVGLPSLLHAWLNDFIGCCRRHPEGYYHFYTERWADKLGKVKQVFNPLK